MHLDSKHPDNRGVLEYLCRNQPNRTVAFEPVTGVPAPNPAAGTHPEIIDYLWETLASGLPVECRALVCGRACLVGPGRGLIFAVPLGPRMRFVFHRQSMGWPWRPERRWCTTTAP